MTTSETPQVVKTPPAKARQARASLMVDYISPWSVMKNTFLLSFLLGIVTILALYGSWLLLNTTSIIPSLNDFLGTLGGGEDALKVENYVTNEKVLAASVLLAVVNCLVFTALATLAAFFYNMTSRLLGGFEVKLSQDIGA